LYDLVIGVEWLLDGSIRGGHSQLSLVFFLQGFVYLQEVYYEGEEGVDNPDLGFGNQLQKIISYGSGRLASIPIFKQKV